MAEKTEKKVSKKTLLIVIIALLVLAAAALAFLLVKLFGGKPTPQDSQPESQVESGQESEEESQAIPVSGLSFDKAYYKIAVSKTATAVVSITPDNADDRALSFATTDPSVATVDGNGVITAVKVGKTKVVVTASNGCKAEAQVEVYEPTYITMPQESYSWNKHAAGAGFSDGWLCTPVLDEYVKGFKLSFSSDNTDVAKVDEKGNVVCYKLGSARITATVSNGEESYSDSMMVYVNGYTVTISNLDFSHEGGGHSKTPVYFYGCHCETTGEENIIHVTGTITKYLDGAVSKYSFEDANAPELELEGGAGMIRIERKGYLKLASDVKNLTKNVALDLSFLVGDKSMETIPVSGDTVSCTLEPLGFTTDYWLSANVYNMIFPSSDRADIYVYDNTFETNIRFTMPVADAYLSVPSRTDEIANVSWSQEYISFVPVKASASAMETDLDVYTAGGQKVTLRIFKAVTGSPVSFSDSDTISLERGESCNLTPGIDSALAEAYGGVTLSYKSADPSVATLIDGELSYVSAGYTTVTVTAKYGNASESKSYTVYCNSYRLSLNIASNNILYYEGPSCKFTITLLLQEGTKAISQGTITPAGMAVDVSGTNYLHWNSNGIYVLEDVPDYVTEKCRFRYVAPDGETIYTDYFNITVEPVLSRPSCDTYNIGFAGQYYVYDLERYAIKANCRIASVKIVQGADVIRKSGVEGDYVFWWEQNGNFTESTQRVAFELTTLGGQTYTAVFVPALDK